MGLDILPIRLHLYDMEVFISQSHILGDIGQRFYNFSLDASN